MARAASPPRASASTALAYALASISLSLANVSLSRRSDATTTTTTTTSCVVLACQCAFTSLVFFVVARRRDASFSLGRLLRGAASLRVAPLACAHAASALTRQAATSRLPLATVVVARHLSPLLVIPLELVCDASSTLPTPRAIEGLLVVALGAGAYAHGTSPEGVDGVGAAGMEEWNAGMRALAAHLFVTAAMLVATRLALLSDEEVSDKVSDTCRTTRSGGRGGGKGGGRRRSRRHPDAFTACVNAATAPVFALAAFVFSGGGGGGASRATARDVSIAVATLPLAAAMSYAQTRAQAAFSATSFTAIGNVARAAAAVVDASLVGGVVRGGGGGDGGDGDGGRNALVAWLGLFAVFYGNATYARETTREAARKRDGDGLKTS